jgi:hypothetical protein
MAKSASKSKQGYQAAYKTTSKWKTNRLRKLARALKRNPGNKEQIEAAMGNVSYRRKTPSTPVWSHSQIATAKLFKKVCGRAPLALFSSNPQTASVALHSLKLKDNPRFVPTGKVSFSIGDIAFKKNA